MACLETGLVLVVVGGGPCLRIETPYVGIRTDDVFVQDKKIRRT